MAKKLALLALLFLLVRAGTIALYSHHRTYYYYGQVAGQFAIAEAKWDDRDFSFDRTRERAAEDLAARERRFVPVSEWGTLPKGEYETFPAVDLPGYGYLIAWTSRLLGGELTSRWAFAAQLLAECAGVLLFVWSLARLISPRVGLLAGLGYGLAYPMIWPQASQPMRDVFFIPILALVVFALTIFKSASRHEKIFVPVAIAIASLLLWVRPSAYFVFFFVVPLAVLTPGRSLRARAVLAACLVGVPIALYTIPVRAFNERHYGTSDLHFLGRGLWEGMGIIPDNPYGFALDDRVLVEWVRSRGVDAPYGSVEMNRVLSEYVFEVLRKDPAYYLKTLAARAVVFAKTPLDFVPPRPVPMRDKQAISVFAYAWADPVGYFYNLLSIYAFAFLWIGAPATVFWLLRERSRWWEILVLNVPLIYTFCAFFPLNHEPRYMAAAAWCVLAAFARGADALAQRWRGVSTSPIAV
ncbi:MAG: hypothetical protein IT350_13920 [Deltaproteobacteria bacterium]|nr:hypothetical protein [Deltaproteobacteria bacterium]